MAPSGRDSRMPWAPKRDLFQCPIVGEHRENDGKLAGLGNAAHGVGAKFGEPLRLRGRAVEDGHLVSAAQQTLDHAAPHVSGSDESDVHRHLQVG